MASHAAVSWRVNRRNKGTEIMYKIVRHYYGCANNLGISDHGRKRTIKSRLTLDEAQEYCRDPETSSSTCTSAKAMRRTKDNGPWFDGYTEI
tara:strand:- start:207 stop:482 length:276 start_codon:yes stop_codon:yes gene_type:complete